MRLLLAGVIIFAIIFLVIKIASRDGGGNGEDNKDTTTSENQDSATVEDLVKLSESSSSSVQFMVDGKVNAIEDHRQIRITVSQNRRVAEVLSGYNGAVTESVTLRNTQEAYNEFLNALKKSGFTNRLEEPKQTDPKGACSEGQRYYFRARSGSTTASELWSTSCVREEGTLEGNARRIIKLFEVQIPEYKDFLKRADVSSTRSI